LTLLDKLLFISFSSFLLLASPQDFASFQPVMISICAMVAI
jgi:hypothetical protein